MLGVFHGVADSGLRAQELVPQTPTVQTPFRVTPSVASSQEYDSNLFATFVAPQADFMTRVSPGIEAEYRSTPLTFLGKYTLDVERFERHPQLTTADGGQHASIDFR